MQLRNRYIGIARAGDGARYSGAVEYTHHPLSWSM